MRNAQVRTLLAGLVLAVTGGAIALTGGAIGVDEVWPVLLIAGAGLLVGVPRLRHALALSTGILGGSVTVWAGAAVLPATPAGRALATMLGLLLLTAVTLATRGDLRLSLQVVGWAATVAHVGPGASLMVPAGAPLLSLLAAGAVTLLVAAGLGLLLAQVTQLVGSGTVHRGGTAASVLVAALAAVTLLPPAAQADTVGARGLVEHHQTVVRTHTADGLVTGGSVVTRVAATGAGDVTIVLRDQAVRGLRSVTGFAGQSALSERGAPEVVGRNVTHRLPDGTVVRTVAALDRNLPVDLDVVITLDGETVRAADVVGRSGRLTVTYTLVNRTAETRTLRTFDGTGRARTTTAEVAVPIVGELVVGLDDRFRGVRSVGGQVSDGVVIADLILAGPVGAPVATVSWTADVVDAVIPPAQVRLVPLALGDTARGGVDLERLRSSKQDLRELADAAGLVRTSITTFRALAEASRSSSDDGLAASAAAILDGLLAGAANSGAELDEVRALIAAQDERYRAGDGQVHALLVAADVRRTAPASSSAAPAGLSAPAVDTSVVYVLDVAGLGAARSPGTTVRLVLAFGLVVAVGLLGRAISRMTAPGAA